MKKIFLGTLIALQVVFPLTPAFAAEGKEAAASEASSAQEKDATQKEGGVQNKDQEQPTEKRDDDLEAATASSGSSATTTTEESEDPTTTKIGEFDPVKVFSGFQGKQDVDAFSGALRYTLPIVVPQGRHGLTPRVSLSYSSLDQGFGGDVGYGWSLPTNAIFRSTNKGVNALYDEDAFTADIFGATHDLVLIDAATQTYAAKDEGDFTTYVLSGSSWTVTDAQGTVYTFGTSADARQDDPNDTSRIYKWMLERGEDVHGNAIVVTYQEDGDAIYPESMFYGGTDESDAVYEIDFSLTDRPAYTDYRTGFQVVHEKLVDEITVTFLPTSTVVATYDLEYTEASHAVQLLTSFALTTPDLTLPETTFSYFDGSETGEGKKLYALKEVEEMTGAMASFTYEPAVVYKNDAGDVANTFPFTVYTVRTKTVQAMASDDAYTTTYAYERGHYYVDTDDAYNREYGGFGKVTVTNQLDETTTYYFHQDENDAFNADDELLGEYADDVTKKGKMYRAEMRDAAGDLAQVNISTWDKTDLSDEDAARDRSLVLMTSAVTLTYNADASHIDVATEYTYDAYGNVLTKVEYGIVVASDDGSFSDIGSDDRTTTTSYATDSAGIFVHVPEQITVTDTTATKIAQTNYFYDSLPFGEVSEGDLTSQQAWIVGTGYAGTTYTYDTYGNRETITDALGNTTTIAYDTYGIYPETVTNALSQVKTFSYDYATGKVTHIEEPNGAQTEATYDGIGRPLTLSRSSDSSATTLDLVEAWEYDDAASPRVSTHTVYLSGTQQKEEITYIDGFERTREVKTVNDDSSGYIEVEMSYDELGRAATSSLPQDATTSAFDEGTADADLIESYTYDVLGRLTETANVIGTTSVAYEDLTQTVTDALGNEKAYAYDGLGRLITVEEHEGSATYTTSYTWSATDKLTGLTDALGNVRAFTYDGRGLRMSAQDLHASADTDFGTWNFSYDAAGNLLTMSAPDGVTTTYTYDDLNRVTSLDASTGTGVEETYTYDSCTNGEGLPCGSTASGYAQSFAYYPSGRQESVATTLGTTAYTTSSTYDIQGNVLTTTEPDGSTERFAYTDRGLQKTIERKGPTDTSFSFVMTDATYGPHGQVASQTYANGNESTYTYDAAMRYRLAHKMTTGYVVDPPTMTSFYAQAGDGFVAKSNANWDTAHDATDGSMANATNQTASVKAGKIGTGGYALERGFLAFDTSSLPDTATITGVQLKIYIAGKTNDDNDGDDFITIVQGNQPSATALTTADFDLAGTVDAPEEFVETTARKDIGTIGVGAYTSFSLNEAGEIAVSLTGNSLFALREGHDVGDSAFTGLANQSNSILFRTSEYTGTSSDPVLEVTYTLPATAGSMQDLTYTYDDVGNITSIVDASDTSSAKTTSYTYDDLYRLTAATVSGSSTGGDGTVSYTYNAIGNITYRSDVGTYSYDGATSTDPGKKFANPHAVTSILRPDSTTMYFSYNPDGTLNESAGTTHTWDYKNRLTSTTRAGVTTSYTYDAAMERTSKATSTTTTYYPSGNYSIAGSTTTIHIGNIATVDITGTTTTVSTNHTDHLGSTAVVTSSSGTLTELLDYYPYGVERLHMGSSDEQRTYIGEYSDDETNYSYLNARYYNPGTGMFLSEDPVFLELGIGGFEDVKDLLIDPQSLNSYSYARDNPVNLTDNSGRMFENLRKWASNTINSLGNAVNSLGNAVDNAYNAITFGASNRAAEMGRSGVTAPALAKTVKGVATGTVGVGVGAIVAGVAAGAAYVAVAPVVAPSVGIAVGTSFGSLGTVVQNQGAKIEGFVSEYTGSPYHGLDQAISRGVTPEIMLNTVRSPLVTLEQTGGKILYLSQRAGVVLDRAGKLVTTYPSSEFKNHVINVINSILK